MADNGQDADSQKSPTEFQSQLWRIKNNEIDNPAHIVHCLPTKQQSNKDRLCGEIFGPVPNHAKLCERSVGWVQMPSDSLVQRNLQSIQYHPVMHADICHVRLSLAT